MNGILGRLALLAGVVAVVLVGIAGPANRFQYVEFQQSIALVMWGVGAAAIALLFVLLWTVFALVYRSWNGKSTVSIGVLLAVGAAFVPVTMAVTAGSLPMIHDITTDIVAPPIFVAIKPLRADAKNGVDYVTDPAQQQKGYPDIQPLVIDGVAPADLFKRAEATAKAMGWEIVAAEAAEGRIEATDTTAWFGFKDDIVIRITAQGTGSRLDIRSMSRVGKSDLGKNADRIRKFLAAVKDAK